MGFSTFKEWLTGAYQAWPRITIACIYAVFLAGALLTHAWVRNSSKQEMTRKAGQLIKVNGTGSATANCGVANSGAMSDVKIDDQSCNDQSGPDQKPKGSNSQR